MPKTIDSIKSWSDTIRKIGEQEIETNNKLSPSKYSLGNITGCARTIYELTLLMKNSSEMAHQDLITFEMAQKILNGTKLRIRETIGYLEAYLGEPNKQKGGE